MAPSSVQRPNYTSFPFSLIFSLIFSRDIQNITNDISQAVKPNFLVIFCNYDDIYLQFDNRMKEIFLCEQDFNNQVLCLISHLSCDHNFDIQLFKEIK